MHTCSHAYPLFAQCRSWLAINKAARYFESARLPSQARIANDVRGAVSAFKPKVPIIVALRNPGMRARHWEALSEKIGE